MERVSKLFKENKIFIAFIILALLASMFVVVQRMSVEKNNRNVDIVVDYEEMVLLAEQSKHDISWWLKDFADMGITKVGLYEETLDSLSESELPVTAELVTELRQDSYWLTQVPSEVLDMINSKVKDEYDVLVTAGSDEMYDFVLRAFTERYDAKKVNSVKTETGGYILIDGTVEDSLYNTAETVIYTDGVGFRQESEMTDSIIMYLDLGLLPKKVATIKNAGCSVEPRTLAYENWNDTNVLKDTLTQYEQLGVKPQYWIMGSKVVPGYDDGTAALSKYIKENDITIGIVENTTQRENISPDGMEDIIKDSDYNVVRIFSVWPYIQYRYGYYGYDSYQEVENSLFRAVVERNIKVIYYKPMKSKDDSHQYITDPKMYKASFESLEKRLERHNISIGEASPSKAYQVPLIAKLLIAIGAGCAALISLREIFPIRKKWLYILLAVGAVGAAGAFFIAPDTAGLLTSIISSIAIPCLAVLLLIYSAVDFKNTVNKNESVWKIIIRGIAVLLSCVAISLVAAMMTAAPISSINYMLELDIFRGVKMAQLLPLGFFVIVFFLMALYTWGKKTKTTLEIQDIKGIFGYEIKIWMILLGIVLLAAGYIYLARTGHETGVEASNLELLIRNYLEEVLYARPRTKEFLVAFPAAILFIYSMIRDMKVLSFIFGLAGVIGFTSVTNTFMHIRTPMELGFSRTGYSIVFGIILGIVYTLILEVIYRIFRKRGNRIDA